MAQEGYIYTIAVEFLYFSSRIQRHFTLRFAPKRTAFSTKTHRIQHQNAVHLAAYCTAFSSKSPKNWCEWQLFEIKIHFTAFTNYPPFASKPTFARIVFLRSGWRLADKKALTMLKFLLKSRQKLMDWQGDMGQMGS